MLATATLSGCRVGARRTCSAAPASLLPSRGHRSRPFASLGWEGQKTDSPKIASSAGTSVVETARATRTDSASPGPNAWKNPSLASASDAVAPATVIPAMKMTGKSSRETSNAATLLSTPLARRSRKRER